ncbi:ABC transporter substrate-binding protein [Oerskovia turbata]|uniref:ABC transporter substrate-binding protein n=1 Tax=Oerskovia turbata TaxID=1713 RepID=A0A4Q1KR17_9CELL|nr:ABC transporter substrate-binding protein [Oerskovia turbata]RXR22719.1 ABC transporter substrate-binding protein [Oerskovia turbata]RXR32055.1 ABC transporter substrate-binding protein [Oerskovia turbata]TGJ96058.1 ABC transporter substrate-binding protein [Actinotalea fermentans ATCC 43279 = JCM 9966 = DSM 3133]
MRKMPLLVAVTAAAALALTACTDASQPADSSPAAGSGATAAVTPFDLTSVQKDDAAAALLPAEIASAGRLVVASNTEYAPAEFIAADGSTPVGYDIDIISAVGAVLGLEVVVESADFPGIIPALGTKYDVGISSFTITAERMAEANMISYFNAGEAFSVQKGNPKDVDPTNICGLTVAVQTGTVEDEGAAEISTTCEEDGEAPLQILRYDNQADATTNLVGGKADIMYADSPIVSYAIEQTKGQIEQIGEVFDSAPQGIVTAKADTELAAAIQAALTVLMEDGTFTDILASWGNEEGALDEAVVNPPAS